jgi:ubiquitin
VCEQVRQRLFKAVMTDETLAEKAKETVGLGQTPVTQAAKSDRPPNLEQAFDALGVAVRAANTADSSAQSCQDSIVIHFPSPSTAASFNCQNVKSTEAYQETWLVSLVFSIPRLT